MRRLLAVSLFLLLAGCAAPGVQMSGGNVSFDLKSVPGEGFVLLRMQSARPSGIFNPKWQTIRVMREGGGRSEEMNDISGAQASGSLFFARLPAGEYRVTEVQSLAPGPGLLLALAMGDYQDLSTREMRFTVRDGALANLGTVVDSPPLDKDPKTRRVVLLRDRLGQAAALEAAELRTGQALAMRAEGGWRGAETEQEAAHALRRARALISVLSPGEDALGAPLLAGTALGQVLIRDAAGNWTSEALPTLATVTYARRLADGTLIAGTEDGRVHLRAPGGAWQTRATPAPVVHVEPLAPGRWLVTTQKHQDISVHRVEPDGGVTRIAGFELGGALFPGVAASADTLLITRNNVGFARESSSVLIDKRTLQVTNREDKYLVFSYQKVSTGEIAMDRFTGMTHYVSMSSDGGRSWRHEQAEAPIWPYFLDAQRGYGLDITRGAFSVDSVIMRTVDGGRTWTKTGTPLTFESGGRVLGVSAGGEILASLGWEVRSSRDEGKTWRRELPRLID